VLWFVEEVLLLDCVISELSAEHFGGQTILFSDSASKLKEQLDLADRVLHYFNLLAKRLEFPELSAESICDNLRPDVTLQVSQWVSLARIEMLGTFGEEADSLAALDQFIHEFYDEGERTTRGGWQDCKRQENPFMEKTRIVSHKRVQGEIEYNDGEFAEIQTVGIEGIE
jgi:hypothetical protein